MSKVKMINCPACGKEISKSAVTCPECGHVIKKRNSGCSCLVGIIVFIAMIAVGLVYTFSINNGIQKNISGVSSDSEYITLEEYNQITNGMTYDEVKAIVGGDGTETATSSAGEYTVTIITWYGNGLAGSNANVTFQNGLVTGKAQVGLQ